jgi:MOB kinase activator 1
MPFVDTPFPSTFVNNIRVIFTRIFRMYAIVYTNHFRRLESNGATSHLNTSFKHFICFVWEFDLVKDDELDALRDILQEVRVRYYEGK